MYYFNSLPDRQYVIICSPEYGYIGYGWPTEKRHERRCHKKCKRRRGYSHYPYSREHCLPFYPFQSFPRYDSCEYSACEYTPYDSFPCQSFQPINEYCGCSY